MKVFNVRGEAIRLLATILGAANAESLIDRSAGRDTMEALQRAYDLGAGVEWPADASSPIPVCCGELSDSYRCDRDYPHHVHSGPCRRGCQHVER